MAKHALYATPTTITRRRPARAAGNVVNSDPAPLDARLIRPNLPVEVVFDHPIEGDAVRQLRGILMGAMMLRGAVHHYRIRHANGVIWFVPSGWFTPASLVIVQVAGLPIPPHEKARCKAESSNYWAFRLGALIEELDEAGVWNRARVTS